jgi:hypothetical protein
MQLSDHPDAVIRHEPACCSTCAVGLGDAAEAGVIRRQVTGVLEAKAVVTARQMADCGGARQSLTERFLKGLPFPGSSTCEPNECLQPRRLPL